MANIPTRFSNYSDVALYSMFRSDEWNRGDDPYQTPQQRLEARQEALQELGNRAARDYGSQPVPVGTEYITGYGSYSPVTKNITVSKSLVESSAVLDSRGNYHYRPASNFRSMANVYHESWHAAQDQARQNPDLYIGDEQTRRDVIANLSNYIKSTPATADLYRIQIAEKQANEYAQAKTMAAIRATEPYYGKDETLAYFDGSLTRTYDEALASARVNFNDPNIDKTLQTAINDSYYGNGLVQQNMPYSYYQIRTILVDQQLQAIHSTPDPSIYQDKINALNTLRDSIQKTGMQSAAVQAQLSGSAPAQSAAAQPQNTPGAAVQTGTVQTGTVQASGPASGTGTEPAEAAAPSAGPARTDSASSAPAEHDSTVSGGPASDSTVSGSTVSGDTGGSSRDSDNGMDM